MLLMGVILLYLLPALALKAVYGPSYSMWSGEDEWVPDGNGGWIKHGHPESPQPNQPSVDVPLTLQYIPIFLPALLLILFLFTPLKKHLESKPVEEDEEEPVPTWKDRNRDL